MFHALVTQLCQILFAPQVCNFNLRCVYIVFMLMSVWHNTHVYLYMPDNILAIAYFDLGYWVAYVMFHNIYTCASLFLSSLCLISGSVWDILSLKGHFLL